MTDAFYESQEYQCYEKSPDYYDLIELPNGRHVPVPIAKRFLGQAIIEAIPVSRKIRDSRFFYCVQCDQKQVKVEAIINGEKWVADISDSYEDGHSFYRCKQHSPSNQEENAQKESMLIRLVLNGMYRSLRYVGARV